MECKEFKNIVVSLFDRVTDPKVKTECERHMAECAKCKRYYDEISQVADMLRPHHSPVWEEKQGVTGIVLRVAAIFIGVLMLSGIVYAAVHMTRSLDPQTEFVTVPRASLHTSPTTSLVSNPVVFKDAELEKILSEMATFYNYKVVYQDEAVRHTRLYYTWDKQMPIEEIIETFNQFNRIHVTLKDRQLFVE